MPLSPPVIGTDLVQWGRQLNRFLTINLGKIVFKQTDDNVSENGIFRWDEANGYAVITSNNAFKEVVMRHSPPPANTGTAGDKAGMISWDTNYIYVCVGTHDGSTAIWKRVALATW